MEINRPEVDPQLVAELSVPQKMVFISG